MATLINSPLGTYQVRSDSKQYTLRITLPDAPRDAKERYIHPDAINSTYQIVTTDIAQASDFATPEAAAEYWRAVKHKLAAGTKATVVRVEKVKQSQLVAANPALNMSAPDLSYVLTRTMPFRLLKSQQGAVIEYTDRADHAMHFPTISAALRSLKNIPGSDVDGISAFRTETSWSFKLTDVQPLVDEKFQLFEIKGSSVVRSLAYNHASKKLRITLMHGAKSLTIFGERTAPDATYEYSNVDPSDVFEFLAAPSAGSHYSRVFKAKYDKGARKVG